MTPHAAVIELSCGMRPGSLRSRVRVLSNCREVWRKSSWMQRQPGGRGTLARTAYRRWE